MGVGTVERERNGRSDGVQSNQYNVPATADAATPSVTQAAEGTRFLVGVVRGSLSSLIGPAEPLFFSSTTCFFSVHLISQSPASSLSRPGVPSAAPLTGGTASYSGSQEEP